MEKVRVGINYNGNCTSCGAEMRDMTDDEMLEYFWGQDYKNLSSQERAKELREIDDNCTLYVCTGCKGTYYLD